MMQCFTIMYYRSWLLLVFLTAITIVDAISPKSHITLINDAGSFKPESVVDAFITQQIPRDAVVSSKFLHLLDCTGDRSGGAIVNRVLKTNFQCDTQGVQLVFTPESCGVTLSTFDQIFSDNNFCGIKAAEYAFSIGGVRAICLKTSSLHISLKCYDQLFRRLLLLEFQHQQQQGNSNSPSNKPQHERDPHLYFVVQNDSGGSGNETLSVTTEVEVEEIISTALRRTWSDMRGANDDDHSDSPLKCKVLCVGQIAAAFDDAGSSETLNSWQNAHQILLNASSRCDDRVSSNNERAEVNVDNDEFGRGNEDIGSITRQQQLARMLATKWLKVSRVQHSPIYSQIYKEALLAIDEAFNSALELANAVLLQLQHRVASGKTVGKFSARVRQLLRSVSTHFIKNTNLGVAAKEKLRRFQQLKEHILANANKLQLQQLVLIENELQKELKQKLLELASANGFATGELTFDDSAKTSRVAADVLSTAMTRFKALTVDLNDDYLRLKVNHDVFRSKLMSIISEFPESGLYQLEEIKRMESQAQREQNAVASSGSKSSGLRRGNREGQKKAIAVSLGLVGMFRPAGYGNLQGFLGYASLLFGMPLEVILGVQNDGDSPEIMGDDREHALLRLQPKINFDVDL